MSEKHEAAVLMVELSFAAFCAGAIIAIFLTRNGVNDLSWKMGMPAFIVTRLLVGWIKWHQNKQK